MLPTQIFCSKRKFKSYAAGNYIYQKVWFKDEGLHGNICLRSHIDAVKTCTRMRTYSTVQNKDTLGRLRFFLHLSDPAYIL